MPFRRALTLLGLTLLAPGAGQLVAGTGSGPVRRAAGKLALRVWLALIAAVVLLVVTWLVNRDVVLGLFTHQAVLRGLAGLLFLVAVGWPLLVLDAWRLGQAPPGQALLAARSRRQLAVLSAVLVIITCGLPISAGRRVWAGADLLGGVFGSQRHSAAVDGRYNVLLLGGDAGPDREGTRPDSMNLASIDARTGRTVLFSLPRNLQNVPFLPGTPAARAMPHGWSCGDVCLLNAIYTWGAEHKQYFPGVADPGAEAMKQVVQAITGLKVNYYVLIDLQGFQSMIDAVGGIEIVATSRVPIGGETSRISGWIEPGRQHLNGYHALWYARSRATSNDYDRMARQRCVMTAMVNQLDPTTLLAHFQQIAAASRQVVSTDIPAGDLPTFLTLGEKAKHTQIDSVQFVPPLIVPRHPDYSVIRSRVAAALRQSRQASAAPVASATSAGSSSPAPASSGSTGSSSFSSPASSPAAGAGSAGSAGSAAVDVRKVCAAA